MWEKSLVHSPFLIERQTNILVCRFLFIMVKTHSAQHNIALAMLSVTALVWGAGFLLSDLLLQNGFADAPFALNALRFAIAAILLALVFCTKVRFNRQTLLYGSVGGVLLFGGFALQLLGLKYTTPAACGFFTASYTLFVPFLVWILFKKRPTFMTMAGVIFALAGLLILNTNSSSLTADRETLLGNMITLGGSLFFAIQDIRRGGIRLAANKLCKLLVADSHNFRRRHGVRLLCADLCAKQAFPHGNVGAYRVRVACGRNTFRIAGAGTAYVANMRRRRAGACRRGAYRDFAHHNQQKDGARRRGTGALAAGKLAPTCGRGTSDKQKAKCVNTSYNFIAGGGEPPFLCAKAPSMPPVPASTEKGGTGTQF